MTNEFLDNICVKYFIKENNLLNTSLIRSSRKRWPNLREYIETTYGDIKFTNFGEVLYRINIYTVHTYIDSVIEEFEIININGNFNATISGNSVTVIATEDNNTSTYLEGSLQLRQKKSNRTILIKLKQRY